MEVTIDWAKSWGCGGWLLFGIFLFGLLSALEGIAKALAGKQSPRRKVVRTSEIHCPKCGHKAKRREVEHEMPAEA